jgi:Dolichyl-phosphate-mannose-protein mannosyltransferase
MSSPPPATRTLLSTRPPRLAWLLAALVALACLLATGAGLRPQTLRDYDQPLYLGIAHDLAATGMYTDGRHAADPAGPVRPGAYAAPLYPALVAGLITLDPRLARAAECVRQAPEEAIAACPDTLGLLLPVQVGLAALTLVLVWRSALAVSDSMPAAWCSLLAAGLLTSQYAVYARTVMTEALSLPLSALMGLLLVLLVQARRPAFALGAGLALGLLSLTRPEYLYLAFALVPAAACIAIAGRLRGSRGRLGALLLLVPALALLVVSPWLWRNRVLFGSAQITVGYAGFILAQRVAYDAMTAREFLAGWVYFLPGFGSALARMIFPAADYVRLGWEERPDTFYMVGQTLGAELMRRVPGAAGQVPWLIRHDILPALPKYAAVTVLMAWEALWVRKYFSLITVPLFFVLTARAARRRDAAVLAFVLPPLFILLLHAAVSVSTPRYSLNLIPCYATAFGMAVAPLLQRVWRGAGFALRRVRPA